MRKIAIIVLLSMVLGVTSVFAAGTDSPSSWAKGAVERGIRLGIVPERLQSQYQSPITREEFAELIVNAVFAHVKDNDILNAGGVDEKDYWTPEKLLDRVDLAVEFEDAKQDHVKLAFILGSVNGVSDTTFEPYKHITRQEAAMMLANTSHMGRGFSYWPKEDLNYSDFDQIAAWAKPAVQAVRSMGLMEGVGDKFDYEGKLTREQSIATVLRLYDNNYRIAIRGNLLVYSDYSELHYTVGKDFVLVNYEDDGKHTRLEEDMYRSWNFEPATRDRRDEFILEHAVALFAFQSVLFPRNFPGIVDPTIAGQVSKWDYGYMKVTIFGSEGLLKFDYPPIPGYMTMVNGYKYGYPFKPVTVTEIKN